MQDFLHEVTTAYENEAQMGILKKQIFKQIGDICIRYKQGFLVLPNTSVIVGWQARMSWHDSNEMI